VFNLGDAVANLGNFQRVGFSQPGANFSAIACA
jgi:hypothetical protein